jgi:anti-sigma factor RsiW
MIDRHGPSPARHGHDPADAAARETRHGVLIELLGAYADGELPAETSSQIDAHLLGCARCRSELVVHESVRSRLAAEPPSGGAAALRARIAAAIDAAPAPALAGAPPATMLGISVRRGWLLLAATAVAAMLVSLPIAGWWPGRADAAPGEVRQLASAAREVPLLDAVLDDYARVTAGDLPGRARDLAAVRGAVPFPVEPLHGERLRLLAAWTTDLGGEPAAVLAYRLDDGLVLQYLVTEQLFFRSPAVRAAISSRHVLAASDGARGVVAWPDAASGSVLVADMPPERLAALRIPERAR